MKRLIVIVGPTAIGKTAAAIEVARQLETEIVSCDSRQFYKELDIGVARPSPEELAAAKHHFIACRSVTEPYNAFDYEHDALNTLSTIFESHDTAVAVGGSGLYVDALCNGINLLPDPTPELRAELSQKIANGHLDELLGELQRLDPEYYAIVDRQNPMRIQRALETIYTSGQPYSSLIGKKLPQRPFDIVKIGLQCERTELKERIYRRVDMMMGQGLLDEVHSLLPFRSLNTLNTVGYKEVFEYLDGRCTIGQATTNIKNHTWQYAKKQLTWLKRYNEIKWVDRKKNDEILQVFCKQ
ncbi:MAG: tRNA (adenosine(37)-N6)-dimethylallyltransferase MiaA [Bacteroidales bacterium]|nr:tRNA (adenosine(37)-N6)-dimethylallyltransferase MiaA [Bacteroidales bacterium]MBR4716263.1 tRNA (adenosine(37)-N6)-dimethylallyltransferase MiaA [Bacteroidales bacterium]